MNNVNKKILRYKQQKIEALQKIFDKKGKIKIQEIKNNLTSSPWVHFFKFFLIFNDSTGMASSIYYISTAIFPAIPGIAICSFVISVIIAFTFSYGLYLENKEKEKENQKKIEEYRALIKSSISHQIGLITTINTNCIKQGKCIKINLHDNSYTLEEQTKASISPSLSSWEKSFFTPLLDIKPSEQQPTKYTPKKIIRFLMTIITCNGTMYTISRLTLTILGIEATATILGSILIGIFCCYSLPLALTQYHFNQREEKYNSELRNVKTQAYQIANERLNYLLTINSEIIS